VLTEIPQPGRLVAFSEDFRYRVHELIALGYGDARGQIEPADDEPAITSRIVEAIEARLDGTEEGRPPWYDTFSVSDNPRVRLSGKQGKYKPQIDILIRCGKTPCPSFHFEAKRLCRPGFPTTKYTRGGGMYESYVQGTYAANDPEAGMIGYVQSDLVADWKAKIQKQIVADHKLLELEGDQADSTLHSAFPSEWLSRHRRPALGRAITIYHLLLDCTLRRDG
jgi:hypothetical protein